MGKSVETIGENVFLNSDSLTSITVDEENPYFMVDDGVLYSKDKRELLYCPKNFSGIYRVAEEVKRIGKSAFRNCNQLTEIVLPEGLEVIGDTAFYGCTQLKQISLPKSVSQIGAYAYKGCPLQGTLDLMNIKDIGEGAFEGCTGLTSVVLPENLLRIEASLFQGCTGLTVVNIPQCVTAIGISAFASCSRLQSVAIPDEVERIEDYAFKGCSNMKHLAIGNSVKKIGVEAFGECRRLKSLSIPASVDSILSSFVDCDSVSSLELKDGNRPILIEGKCFNGGNMMIDTLYIGRKISGVPQFNECAYLSTLTVGSMILTMQDVSGCKDLSKVICLGATPPEATMTTFSTVTLDGTLVVPASAEEVYRRTAPWRFFYTIETFPDVAPAKLILDTESYQITREDEVLSLLATVYPEHATFSGLRWTSSNEMVATVSETGIVHSNKEGEADITVSLNDGALTATCHVSVHYVDAVEEHEADQVSIYPNPVDDMLHIDGVITGTSITLYDMTGRLVLSDRAYGGAMTFDMSALKRGVYLCRIQNRTYKIVKR
ncbi:leucine-rich repeat protein [Barnesiella sp. B2-R-119]|nr:leucine-rich repeat protein [Barnesiella sp. B2-R-119]